jgi:hypothetical protein
MICKGWRKRNGKNNHKSCTLCVSCKKCLCKEESRNCYYVHICEGDTQLPDLHQPIGTVSLNCGRPLLWSSFSFLFCSSCFWPLTKNICVSEVV